MDRYMDNHIKKGTYDFLKKTVRNNTFSLNNTIYSIKDTIYNSFSYLEKLQLSYTNIPKFTNIRNDKIIFKDDMYPHLYIDKDFIDNEKRESYRLDVKEITDGVINRSYYNKYIPWIDIFNSMIDTYGSINSTNYKYNNNKIFTWLPLVFRNGKIDVDIEIKFEADGAIDIRFVSVNTTKPHRYSLNETNYRFDVIFFKNVEVKKDRVNTSILSNGCSIPSNIFYKRNYIFALISNDNNSTGLLPLKKSSNGKYLFTETVTTTGIGFSNNSTFDIYYLSPANIVFLDDLKTIKSTVNGREAIVCLEKSNDTSYDEPIPKENILAFKYKSNNYILDFDAEITDHYPNIYEIKGPQDEIYSYKICYLYQELPDNYKYDNKLKYVYKYLKQQTGTSNSIEDCIYKFLTDNDNIKVTDEKLLELFNKYWNYKDISYDYSNLDFWLSDEIIDKDFYYRNLDGNSDSYRENKIRDYDYLYKINKMQTIVNDDFSVLKEYGKKTNIPFKSYYFNIRESDFDLESIARYDSYTLDYKPGEDIPEENKIDFVDEYGNPLKHYLFKFRNEDDSRLYLNIFIDGKQVPRTNFNVNYGFKVIEHPLYDYIYIPSTYFDNTSTIVEIERLGNYKFTYKQYFTNTDLIKITFTEKEMMMPTLFDLFVVNENNERLSWTYDNSEELRFDVYVKIPDDSQYAVEDHDYAPDNIFKDGITGEYYIRVNDLLLQFEKAYKSEKVQEELDLLPMKYIGLEKILIRCKDNTLYNTKLKILINKNPYTFTKKMTKDGIPKIRLYQGRLLWRGMVSYIRTFLNGYYLPITYKIEEVSSTEVYLLPRVVVNKDEIIDFEISPYSYELEFYIKDIPSDRIIDFEDKLSRPFDFDYYDLYVNGLKFNKNNITILTPTKIRLENISYTYNVAVYRRDKDYEYYIKTNTITPTDDVIKKGGGDVIPPTPPSPTPPKPKPEEDIDRWIRVMSDHDYQYYMFYLNKIIPRGITRGNDWNLNKDELNSEYPIVYDSFSNKINRIVMRPNVDHDLREVLMIGHKTDMTIGDINYIIDEE